MSLDSEFDWAALIGRMVRPWDVPRVLIDSGGLRTGAARIRREGHEVEAATAAVLRSWQRLPAALAAPGVVEPLYPAMTRPAMLGRELAGRSSSVSSALSGFADLADEFRPIFARLRQEVEDLNREILAGAAASAVLTDLIVDTALRLLSARNDHLQHEVDTRRSTWSDRVAAVATNLRGIRADLPLDLIAGSAAARTAGLTGPSTGDPSRADFDLLTEWATGRGPRHRVFTAGDPFTRLLRRDPTIRNDVAMSRMLLSQGSYEYGAPLIPPDGTSFGRSVGGLKGIRIAIGDVRTWLDHLQGGSSGNIADSFLGSYAVTVVPLARVGSRSVRVQFTVENATTLASGTRPPVLGYGEQSEELGRAKNDEVPTGPFSETTQTITWPQVVSWPAKDRLRRTAAAR